MQTDIALKAAFEAHGDELVAAAKESPFVVFVCGPGKKAPTDSAKLRKSISNRLKRAGFEVVLGEDDGISSKQLHGIGVNAQDSELEFIRTTCSAVVIVADSVGSFCELGLFSWHYVHQDGVLDDKTDCIVLLDAKHKPDRSYLNLGPVSAVNGFGRVDYVDFKSYDPSEVVNRLKSRRGVYAVDNRRGRPRGRSTK